VAELGADVAEATGKVRPGTRVPAALLDSVVAYFQPRRVILFGSAARGDTTPESDLDLLVVLDDDTPDALLHWRGLWEARKDYSGAVDLMACRAATLDRRARAVGSLAHTILTEGLVVYERA
jgi:uncharacterized protein